MNAIETKLLKIERGTFKLGPIDLSVKEGEIFAILGRTGSGKSKYRSPCASSRKIPETS